MESILIVDSEEIEVSRWRRVLDRESLAFETALSGKEAVRALERNGSAIKAILLDWVLPDMDGIDLLGWIKERGELADIEVVIQSTEIEPENIEKGIGLGAYYYLTKPFQDSQLCAIVRAAINTFNLKRSLLEKIEEAEDIFDLLSKGAFRLRSPDEARHLAVHIGSACGDPQQGVGVFELLINAVSHGNLGITYEEKGRLLAESGLEAEWERRLSLPENHERWVIVEMERTPRYMDVLITDAGSGFDFKRYMKMDEDRVFDLHGRGILLAHTLLDMEYIEPGNKVHVRLPMPDLHGKETRQP